MNDEDLTQTLRDLLADESTWADPPPDGADALLAAIRAERSTDAPTTTSSAPGQPTSAPPTGDPRQAQVPAPSPGEPRHGPAAGEPGAAEGDARVVPMHLRRRTWPRLVLAAAAVVLVAGVVGGIALSRDGGGAAREVAISGTDLAPEASAVATVEELGSGVAIELDVQDLPPAEPGTYYEAWLKNDTGSVPIGTFHMRAGDEVVELWAGVDLADYPMLTVTRQQEGAGQESSGQVVLSGQIG